MPFNVEEVKRRRAALSKTQDEMAFLAGFEGKMAWSRYECGRVKNPRLDSLESIALALGCKVEDLIITKPQSKRRMGADGVRR